MKIISYSLYVGDRRTIRTYTEGCLINLEQSKFFYPDWVCKFYVSEELEYIGKELEKNGGIVVIEKKLSNHAGMIWRNQTILNDNFEACIFRDADSRLSYREVNLVNLWLESNKNYHIIRDCDGHWRKILGGMWGVKKVNDGLKNIFKNGILEHINKRKGYGEDEDFFENTLWNYIKDDALVHDSNVDSTPFGQRIDGHFIGEPFLLI